jgi:competence protein ComEC
VAAYCGESLLRLAGAVATALWPGLCWFADLPGSLWHARPTPGWYLLAVPAVMLVLLPLAWRTRVAALALLMSVFLLREPRPAAGVLWIDAQGQGGAATLLLRTRTHLLLLGSGEVYGSGGRRFARQVLPRLRAAGYSRLDLWLPGSLTREAQLALRQADAELTVVRVVLAPSRDPPPELMACTAARWQWDGIEFELRASADRRECVLAAIAGGQRVEFDRAGSLRGALDAHGKAQLALSAAGLARRAPFLRL